MGKNFRKRLEIATISHFVVDFSCGYLVLSAMMASIGPRDAFGYNVYVPGMAVGYLVYNFCAFALQLPVGFLVDRFAGKKCHLVAGAGCVVIGAAYLLLRLVIFYGGEDSGCIASPIPYFRVNNIVEFMLIMVLAGIGNALFHVGEGVEIIKGSRDKMAPVGIFVSTGAMGIYLGKRLAEEQILMGKWIIMAALVVTAVFLCWNKQKKEEDTAPELAPKADGNLWNSSTVLIVLLVIILRFVLGFAVKFNWVEGEIVYGVLLAVCIVIGKAFGGMLADKIGMAKATYLPLGLAAVLFLASDFAVPGLLAILLFQTTMPITLGILVRQMPERPGLAFGFSTFGLFAGYLFHYFDMDVCLHSTVAYAIISISSALLLLYVYWRMQERNVYGKN